MMVDLVMMNSALQALLTAMKTVQNMVVSRSDRPAKVEGDDVKVNVVNGVFIAAEVDWSTVTSQMGREGYKSAISDDSGIKRIVRDLGLETIFPPEKFTKDFSIDGTGKKKPSKSSQEVYCSAAIQLETSSQSQAEISSYLPSSLEECNVPSDRAKPILDWLKKEGGGSQTFYDVVEFEIWCSFDVRKYLESKKRLIQKKLGARKMNLEPRAVASKTIDRKNLKKGIKEERDRLVDLATKLTEMISEKKVYPDFYKAFKDMKPSPFTLYIPKLLDLSVELNRSIDDSIKLGQEIKAKAKIKNLTENRKFKINKEFKVEADSQYFAINQSLCEDGPIGYDEEVEVTITLKPIIEKIIEKRKQLLYPVKFIVSSLSNHTTLNEKTLQVPLEDPDVRLTAERTFLPHKGEPIEVCFKALLSSSAVESIPIKVKYASTQDFTCNEPSKGEMTINASPGEEARGRYFLVATRAGLPGYSNTARFDFSVGEWGSIATWRMSITVLPNWLDTIIAGFTAFAVILSQFYPGLIPSLTTEPNVATLSSTASIIYLAFRAITWGLASQKR